MNLGSNDIIKINESGASVQTGTPEEIVAAKLRYLLSVNRGEIAVNPDFGTDLIQCAHIPIDDSLKNAILDRIRKAIAKFMPYVIIDSLQYQNERGIDKFSLYYRIGELSNMVDFNLGG